jgi:hypothetical protein
VRGLADRLVAIGVAIFGVGATFAAAYWIYVMQREPQETFWQQPGYASVALIAAGAIVMVIGLATPGNRGGNGMVQKQRGGRDSVNIQSGRDTYINGRE